MTGASAITCGVASEARRTYLPGIRVQRQVGHAVDVPVLLRPPLGNGAAPGTRARRPECRQLLLSRTANHSAGDIMSCCLISTLSLSHSLLHHCVRRAISETEQKLRGVRIFAWMVIGLVEGWRYENYPHIICMQYFSQYFYGYE